MNAYVMALGMFDGVHLGHRALLAQTAAEAKRRDIRSLVYTFSNHPKSVFSTAPEPLMSADEKRQIILSLGIDEVVMRPFDKETANLSPEAFIEGILSEYRVQCFAVGRDYAFGRGGKGNVETLLSLGKTHGFGVLAIDDVLYEGETISSTRIRALLDAGDAETAKKLLGAE
ncbi:MAG: hypothetical protein ACOYI8_02025 [Christensenellales bacterium]|jgi:riboflavin kinase/FMN adenylyltransferase